MFAYHRMGHPINEYRNPFITSRNTRASAALGALSLVIQCCRTDQFSRSFLPAVECPRILLPLGVFSGT